MQSATLQTPTMLDPTSPKLIWNSVENFGILHIGDQKFRIRILHVADFKGISTSDCDYIAERIAYIMAKRGVVNKEGSIDEGFRIDDQGLTTFSQKLLKHDQEPNTKTQYDEIIARILGAKSGPHSTGLSHGTSAPLTPSATTKTPPHSSSTTSTHTSTHTSSTQVLPPLPQFLPPLLETEEDKKKKLKETPTILVDTIDPKLPKKALETLPEKKDSAIKIHLKKVIPEEIAT